MRKLSFGQNQGIAWSSDSNLEGKDLFVLEGVSAEDAELLDCILRKKDSHLHPFPYSVVEMDGNPCILCLSEDMEKLKEAMKAVAATFESE